MNKDWSELNSSFQEKIGKKETFSEGIKILFQLRNTLFDVITATVKTFPEKSFYAMPFPHANGFHNLTLSFSIWHIFRIEDIVVHTMIKQDEQIFFTDEWQKRIGVQIVTTANELDGQEVVDFSKTINVQRLYEYVKAVKESTDQLLINLEYSDLKKKFTEEDKKRIIESGSVSDDADAVWLIDYWCEKDIKGLMKMPLSRHWIMHVEAMERIKNQLCKLARKGMDPVACCGFSCNHCFLSQWCGSCKSEYNTCSFATLFPGNLCPNVACCREKGVDGCYDCSDLETCNKGFYTPENDGAQSAKAQALFVRKYGKKAFLKMQDNLHAKYQFTKTQEVLGYDVQKALSILEENKE